MENMKKQVRLQLVESVLKEKCAQCKNVLFQSSLCSHERVVRFTTPFFRDLFSTKKESGDDAFSADRAVMYEICFTDDTLTAQCVLFPDKVPSKSPTDAEKLMHACGLPTDKGVSGKAILKVWEFRQYADANDLFSDFDSFLTDTVPAYEKAVQKALKPGRKRLTEGARLSTALDKYERNRKAREACLAAHGHRCAVCGIDFGKEYGAEFEGLIEVHHIVPLSETEKEHIVDPVKDLVPVCPNCHTALHSKKDGTYTVKELKKMRKSK